MATVTSTIVKFSPTDVVAAIGTAIVADDKVLMNNIGSGRVMITKIII